MTAHPVTCLVDYEDGYRTVITLEEGSDSDAEEGAIARLRITMDDGKTIQVGLSPEALNHLGKRFDDLRVEHGDDPTDALRNTLWATQRSLEGAIEQLNEIAELVRSLRRGDKPERAVGILGQIAEVLKEGGRLGCPECQQ